MEAALKGESTGLWNVWFGVIWEKEIKPSSVLNAVKRCFGSYRSRSLCKLTACVCNKGSGILLSLRKDFLSVWIKINSGATKWNYPPASSAPDVLRLAFIRWVFILWQPDKRHGPPSAPTHLHWTPPLNSNPSLTLLAIILLHLQPRGVPPALLFPLMWQVSGAASQRRS